MENQELMYEAEEAGRRSVSFLTICCTSQPDAPAVNASSKGHLPVVLYLLSKQSANPLVRNNRGETAFDVAATVFEVWICEVSFTNWVLLFAE
jgi:hypothetical protein